MPVYYQQRLDRPCADKTLLGLIHFSQVLVWASARHHVLIIPQSKGSGPKVLPTLSILGVSTVFLKACLAFAKAMGQVFGFPNGVQVIKCQYNHCRFKESCPSSKQPSNHLRDVRMRSLQICSLLVAAPPGLRVGILVTSARFALGHGSTVRMPEHS